MKFSSAGPEARQMPDAAASNVFVGVLTSRSSLLGTIMRSTAARAYVFVRHLLVISTRRHRCAVPIE
jgi:hypothetical protein